MSNEPELIVNTVVDPKKWEEALGLLAEVARIADYAHDCDADPFCEDCEFIEKTYDFLREVE